MPLSEITISSETVVEIAKMTLMPLPCEVENCPVIANCWKVMSKHLLEHARVHRRKEIPGNATEFLCKLPGCGTAHNSKRSLQEHIMMAHASRIPFPCPVQTCGNMSFSRPRDLIEHFEEVHADLLGRLMQLPSDILLPSWKPFYFVPRSPPPLPGTVVPGCVIIGAVPGGDIRHHTPTLESSLQPPLTPARRRMLHNDTLESVQPATFSFPDLHSHEKLDALIKDAIVFRRPPHLQGDNARPAPMLEPFRCCMSLPKTILYDVFAQRIERGELPPS